MLPLTHTTVYHFMKNTGIKLRPHEIEALIDLDKVRLYPAEPEPET